MWLYFSQWKGFVLSGWITNHILASSSQIQFYGIPLKRYLHPLTSVFPTESWNSGSVPYCHYQELTVSSVCIRGFKRMYLKSTENWTSNGNIAHKASAFREKTYECICRKYFKSFLNRKLNVKGVILLL